MTPRTWSARRSSRPSPASSSRRLVTCSGGPPALRCCGSALARRVTLRGGRNARPVSSGPSGPTRGQAGAPAGRQEPLEPSQLAGAGGRGGTSLTPASVGPGGISRRVRASAERGRVQGPGRAEADLGLRAVPVRLLPSVIAEQPPGPHLRRFSAPRLPPDGSPDHPPDPSPDGSPNPSPDGSPWGWGTWGRRPRTVPAGQDARGAGSRAKTARDPAPLRYVGVRPIDSSPVDGPPSSAHSGRNSGGRTIHPALRAGRAYRAQSQKTNLRLRRHSPISMCRLLRLTDVVAVISLDLCDVHHNGGRRRTGGYLDAVWAGGTIQASGDRWPAAAAPASTLIVPATRPRRLPCSGWDGPAVVPAPAPPAATPSNPSRKRPRTRPGCPAAVHCRRSRWRPTRFAA